MALIIDDIAALVSEVSIETAVFNISNISSE